MTNPWFSCHFLILFYYVSFSFHVLVVSGQCSSNQQQSLLLQLKDSLKFDAAISTKLVKWNDGSEYCSWEGVSCKGDCVTHLDLSSESITGGLDNTCALFDLQYIKHLNLAYNNFNYTQIPSQFNKLASLNHLNLSNANFAGQIPTEISQLTRLVFLDLSTKYFTGAPELQLKHPDLNLLIGNLSEIIELHLDGVNISAQGAQWGQAISSSLPKLRVLSLSSCNLSGPIPKSMESLTELVYVDMSANKLNGSVPSLSMAKNLTNINLSHNELTGQINSTRWENLPNLVNLNLGDNKLDGSIPSSLFYLPSLKQLFLSNNQFSGQLLEFSDVSSNPLDTLDLSSNNLEGPVPGSIFNLKQLKILTLSSNNFNGSFPLNSVQQLKNLSSLDLSYNRLSITYYSTNSSQSSFPNITTLKLASGKLKTFPDFLSSQSKLSTLDLSQNQIHGEIPNWIWRPSLNQLNLSFNSLETLEGPLSNHAPMLTVLDLHANQLQGRVPIFLPFATYLDYSRNNFTSSIPTDIGDFLNYIVFLSLSSNKIEGSIPESVCNVSNLQVLDLSNNSLSGYIPQCLTAISGNLVVLNLRRNQLAGTIPDRFPGHCSLKTLDLNGNHLEGQFPKSLANCTVLEVLNLGNNQIMEIFPCLLKNISLRVLVLRANRFYGHLGCRNTTGTWPMLQIVDIAHNNFSGAIPGRGLTTWRAMMGNEDDAQSKINYLQFRVLKFSGSNYQDAITVTTKGREMELVKILTVFTLIDFSCNNFNGPIPAQLGQLKALHGLNFSNNALTGPIPLALSNLTQLESLDLSNNSLSGPIPPELTFLSFLNLSNNRLSGLIPTGNQFSTFSQSSYEDNEGLCGAPLSVRCSNTPGAESNDENKERGINWELISVEIGFTCGFGIAIASLFFCKRWRIWYYRAMRSILFKIFPQLEERFGGHRRHVHINPRWRR